MAVVISYLKDNYLDLAIKAVLSILSIILLLLRSRSSEKLKIQSQLSAFLLWLPSAVKSANELFPAHGDGSKRFNYVVEKCSSLFPLISLSIIVESVDQILSADKKGGGKCETDKSTEETRSQDLQQNCSFGQSEESSSASDERRHSSIIFRR